MPHVWLELIMYELALANYITNRTQQSHVHKEEVYIQMSVIKRLYSVIPQTYNTNTYDQNAYYLRTMLRRLRTPLQLSTVWNTT
jgi:tRNA C32,U32 (ribose-2'-O)-methylase TrmJ